VYLGAKRRYINTLHFLSFYSRQRAAGVQGATPVPSTVWLWLKEE